MKLPMKTKSHAFEPLSPAHSGRNMKNCARAIKAAPPHGEAQEDCTSPVSQTEADVDELQVESEKDTRRETPKGAIM